MHDWGDKSVDWEGINAAAEYIGTNLRKWGRVSVMDYKEKFGTVRVYCHFGWSSLHSITHPGYCYSQYPTWLWNLDCIYFSRIIPILNYIIIPIHKWLYPLVYSRAIRKWPHLEQEIVFGMDYPELLNRSRNRK